MARLATSAATPIEQPPTWHAELAGDSASEYLPLIEAPFATAAGRGGRPRDDVDLSVPIDRDEAVDDEATEMTTHRSTVAVLQPQEHITNPPRVRQCCHHTIWRGAGRMAQQRHAAGGTDRRTGPVTARTTCLKHHGDILTRGCHTAPNPADLVRVLRPSDAKPSRSQRMGGVRVRGWGAVTLRG